MRVLKAICILFAATFGLAAFSCIYNLFNECSVFIKQFAVLWHFPKYLARSHRTFAREFIQRNVPDEIVADFDIKSALTSL